MCSRRLTNPSMGSLPGSLIQRETRSSYGSRLKASEEARVDDFDLALPRARAFVTRLDEAR